MGWEKFFSDEGTALPLGLALMRMGGRSDRPRNLGVELGTAFEQQAKMQQAKQQQMLQQMQMEKIKAAILKEKNAEQYGEDYLNATNPQDPNLRYLARSNPGGLAELLAKQKLADEQQNAEMARFGFGQPQQLGTAPVNGQPPSPLGAAPTTPPPATPLAGAMEQGPQGMFQGDPKQIAAEIMRIKDPAERQAAMQALNQQFNPQPQQPVAPQAPQGLPPQLAGITPEKALMMSMSKSPSIAMAGKLMLKHYEDAEKRKEGLANKKEMADYIAQLKQDNPQSVSPFFTPVPTPDGIVSYDNRKGTGVPLIVNGKNVVKSADSIPLQGALSGAKEAGKGVGEMNLKQYETAQSAVPIINKIDQQLELINKGDITTGFAAEFRNDINRAKSLLGSKAATGKVTDTEVLEAMMGSDVFGMITSLGIGARGLDTPAEREFMRQTLVGTKTLNKETLKEMANIRRKVAERAIERFNNRIDTGELDSFFEATKLPRQKIAIPNAQSEQSGSYGKKAAPKFLGFE